MLLLRGLAYRSCFEARENREIAAAVEREGGDYLFNGLEE